MSEVVIDGVTYVPVLLPNTEKQLGMEKLPAPFGEPEPVKTCAELMDEIEAEAPKGKTLVDRARRVKYLERCKSFRETDLKDHVCSEGADECYNGDRECLDDNLWYEGGNVWVTDYGFIPRSNPQALLTVAMETLDWRESSYRTGDDHLFKYLMNALELGVTSDSLVATMPGVIPVSDGEEFLGWLIEE